MNNIELNQARWDRLRSMANGIVTIAAELRKQLAKPPVGDKNAPISLLDIAATLDVFARLLTSDLDALSPTWAGQFAAETGAQASGRKRRPNRKDVLASAGFLQEGTEIVVEPTRLLPDADGQSPVFRARMGRHGKKVTWMGEEVALSPLTVRLRDQYGVAVNKGAVNGFKYWCLATDTSRTLWDLAEELD